VALLDPLPAVGQELREVHAIPVLLASRQNDKRLAEECPSVCRAQPYSSTKSLHELIAAFLLKPNG
jgi:hypothetical protein